MKQHLGPIAIVIAAILGVLFIVHEATDDERRLVYEPLCTDEDQEKLQAWVIECLSTGQSNPRDCRYTAEEVLCSKAPQVRYHPCAGCMREMVPCSVLDGSDLASVCPGNQAAVP